MADLSTQYYLDADSAEQQLPRAQASFARLAELNPLVQLRQLEPQDDSLEALVTAIEASGQSFDVVVAADQGREREAALNDLARRLNAKFVAAQAPGVFGSVFCDFGDEFTVNDADGREPKTGVIKAIEHMEVRSGNVVIGVEMNKPFH